MTAPLLLDLSHTSHTQARTGVQRVTRALQDALGERAVAITHDPYRRTWRELEAWERRNLSSGTGAAKRGARWPVAARWRGRLRRVLGRSAATLPAHDGLVVPEIFSPAVGLALPELFRAVQGPRVALFHDAIALRLPELTPPGTVRRFPAYLVELLGFDGIAAVSEDSRAALRDYWQWLGVARTPPVVALPLGVELPADAPAPAPTESAAPTILCVGSIEGRKNHLALLEACEGLWAGGARFALHLIGLAQPQTAGVAIRRIQELRQAGRPLRYDGPVGDAAVAAAYAGCTFTVYPSLMEGFGLPVIESLAHGKPCVCSGRGALGESAAGGGCLALDRVTAPDLAAAIGELLASPGRVAELAAQARARRFKSWAQYAGELTAWMATLRR